MAEPTPTPPNPTPPQASPQPAPGSAPEPTIDFGFENVARADKQARVRRVFDTVAADYDRMNDVMSAGLHRVWKDMAITRINPRPGERLLDVAGGTGDIARRFVQAAAAVSRRRGGAPASAVILDINAAMLRAGIDPARDAGMDLARICGNAESLPFADNSFDCVTIAYGIRNVTDRMAALREFRRVLRPGGRMGALVFHTPPQALIRRAYDAYSFGVMPRLGALVAGERDSYQYLVESIRRFPGPDQFSAMVAEAGFAKPSVTEYTMGVSALHMGWKL